MTESGRLILVVGPSGAGKDTLLAGAAARLAHRQDIIFPRRQVTRQSQPDAEDHLSISEADFEQQVAKGDLALAWRAHGLGYVVPASVGDALRAGKTVVVNVSRAVIEQARQRFPGTATILVTASPQVRAERLALRGRESSGAIAQRLDRSVDLPLDGPDLAVIDNSSTLAVALEAFVGTIETFASVSPMQDLSQ